MRCVSGEKLALAVICALILTLICSANTLGGNSGGSCIAGNCYNGHGTWLYDDGGRYVGQWSNGKRNGQGIDYFANGDIYDGQFFNDARSGYGKLTFGSGQIYTGQWANNKRNGQGRDERPDGSMDEGNFVDDQLVRGKVKYVDGLIYTGEFSNIEGERYRHGLGTLKWTDGSSYTGSFKKSDPDGKGVYTDANGVQWDQVWENGHKISGEERVSGNYSKPGNNILPSDNATLSSESHPQINTSKDSPNIHFDEFTILPERVKAGGKFQLTVRYTALDNAKGPKEPLPITFYYELFKDNESVFKSKSRIIQSPNNQSTFALENYNIKAKKKGEYLIRIYLWYERLVGKMSQNKFVIE